MTAKYILVALESVNRYEVKDREVDMAVLDTYSSLVREDNGFARQFDSFERAMQAWQVYVMGRKDSASRDGWLFRPDEEDDESALRMRKYKHGRIWEERLVVPAVYAVQVPETPEA